MRGLNYISKISKIIKKFILLVPLKAGQGGESNLYYQKGGTNNEIAKEKIAGVAFIVMVFVLMISFTVPSLAETLEKDGVEVIITTDKESYSTGEEILINVMARNIGAKSIGNIKIELQIPDGVTLAEGIGRTVFIETLLAGEEKTAVVTAKAEEHFDVGDNGSNGNISGSVETGDTQNPVIYIVMLSLTVATVVGLAFTEKKIIKRQK